MNVTVTYGELVREIAVKLSVTITEKDAALRTARRLVEHFLQLTPTEMILKERDPAPTVPPSELAEGVKRAISGEPITRIIGKTSFYGYDFRVSPYVLDPRSDTELVIDTVKKHFPNPETPLKILDVGAGSGCLAITLAKEFSHSHVIGIDLCEKALITANENAVANDIRERCVFLQCDFLSYSENNFDLVVSNPPYLTEIGAKLCDVSVRDYDPKLALVGGEDGLKLYRDFIPEFWRKLVPKGRFVAEFGIGQGRFVKELAETCGFADVTLMKDASNLFRCVTGVKIA